ncbi:MULTISPECIES: ABC transporter substrate-binding protein [Paenibacillus]|uniref:ABC transporter substrate-binding protein n=1 Tax=Paenibacillus albilobatus TaxID=2716884 RepID=A0A919XM23_9BACL|nr:MULTISPECIES: extracellular solute-binding protein [Paenibacillus]GIO33908.1 ABC transporter substrate-binding protein [Paenibacillus albilobatus]
MNQRKRCQRMLLAVFLLLTIIVSGCSSPSSPGSASAPQETAPKDDAASAPSQTDPDEKTNGEPVTVKILYPWGADNFELRYRGIEKLLPNVTIELVDSQAQMDPLQELNAQKIVPDIIFANWGLDALYELDMIEPLDDLIQKHQFDLDTLDPSLLASIRSMDRTGKGRILGFPIQYSPYGIWYNKDVFDKFGIEYPAERLTWDEVAELAKQMTAERDGVQYRGLEMGPGLASGEVTVPLSQLAVNLTDPDTGEVLIDKEPAVTRYLELMKKIYSIPGIVNEDPEARKDYEFPKKNVGMIVSWIEYLRWGVGDPEVAANMEAAPLPVWGDGEESAPPAGSNLLVINKYSEHKDAAFKVLMAYLSPEHQTELAKIGDAPPLFNNKDVISHFGEDVEVFKGKNVAAFYEVPPALPPAKISSWDQYVDIGGSMLKFSRSDMDIASFLRQLKEESAVKITEAKNQKE